MKYRYLTGLLGLTMLTSALAGHLQVSLDDIVLLNHRGVSDQTILLFLENRELGFVPDSVAIDKLLLNGVSEEIISYLLAKAVIVQVPDDVIPPTAYTDAPPDYPETVYPDDYYTPYYGGSYSIGYVSYPVYWYGGGHHSGRHHPRHGGHNSHKSGNYPGQHNGQGATHSTQNGGAHAGGAGHTANSGQQEPMHPNTNHTEKNKPHTAMAEGQHKASSSEHTSNNGTNSIAHSETGLTANGKSHHTSRTNHSRSGVGNTSSHNGGSAHTGSSSSYSGIFSSGTRHTGGHSGGHSGGGH